MIIQKIIGGLGNQIPQYAFARCCADRLGVALKLDITAFREYKLHAYGLDRFVLEAEVATDEEIAAAKARGIVQERTLLFDPAIPRQVRDGLYLEGYWGDYRYTQGWIDEFRRGFTLREPLAGNLGSQLRGIQEGESVSLHIPKVDDSTDPHCVPLPFSYYEDALKEMFHRVPRAHVYIFSDDLDELEANLPLEFPHTFVRGDGDGAERSARELHLMRSCRHHILANTVYASLPAWLDGRSGGVVVVPQQRYAPDDPDLSLAYGGVDQPIFPPEWLILPIRQPEAKVNPYLDIAGGHVAGRPIKVGVWNYYEELTTDGFIFKNSNVSIGHNLLKPCCDLYAYGQVHGIDFVTLDQVSAAEELDAVVFQDRPRMGPQVSRLLALDVPKYLFLCETEVIKPDNWDLSFHAQFDHVFTWNDDLVDNCRYIKTQTPFDPESPYDFQVLKTAFQQRRLCTLIAGAKLVQHPNELYSERIRAIQWFQTHAPQDFDLYGIGWNPEMFPSYRGAVQDKLATLSRYRFCICFENARNYPGYITEKIIDCFRAGVVPVYLGAPNITDWIPAGCFIDLNAFQNYEQLFSHLSTMDPETHGAYLDRIHEFLSSEKVYPFSTECYITTLTALLARDVLGRRGDNPGITVAIPTYNHGHFLDLAVGSALAQEVQGLEVLVIDNASTDDTPKVLAQFAGDKRLRYMRNTRNFGACVNGNIAFLVAGGRYVTFLSADDFYLPGHLKKIVGLMEAHPEVSLGYCPCIWVDEVNKPLQVLNHIGHFPSDYVGGRNEVADLLTYDCYITPAAAVIRRTVFDLIGQSDKSLKGAGDWDLWIRIAEKCPDFAFSKEPLVCYRIHPGQDTAGQVASANILVDHIAILWSALERGSLPLFQKKAAQVLGLLRGKFSLYPAEKVGHLEPHYAALERVILGETKDIAGEHRRAILLSEAAQGNTRATQEGFLFELEEGDASWTEVLMSYLTAFTSTDPVVLVLTLKGAWTVARARTEINSLARQLPQCGWPEILILDRPEQLLEISRGCRSLRWIPQVASMMVGWTGALEVRLLGARRNL